MPAILSSLSIGLAVGAVALVVSACALLAPLPEQQDVSKRLAAFPTEGLPLDGAVTIHWSERQIPSSRLRATATRRLRSASSTLTCGSARWRPCACSRAAAWRR